jgi:hypothetical protein
MALLSKIKNLFLFAKKKTNNPFFCNPESKRHKLFWGSGGFAIHAARVFLSFFLFGRLAEFVMGR